MLKESQQILELIDMAKIGIIPTIIKIGFPTIAISGMAKVLGQKELSDIIKATGYIVCGLALLIGIKPLYNGIIEFANDCGNFFTGLSDFVDSMSFWN